MSPNKQRAYEAMLTALRHAKEELERLAAQGACVRPDVPYDICEAIKRGQEHALNA